MLNVICNIANEVVDIASEKENLSRGYQLPVFKKYLGLPDMYINIGDLFDGVTVTPNPQVRAMQRKTALQSQLIDLNIRKDKAEELGFIEQVTGLNWEITECEKELATLSSL